jgi:hypothetical protein
MSLLLDILSGLGGGWDQFRARQPRQDSARQLRRDQDAHRRMEQNAERIRHRWNGEQLRRQQWSNDPRDWGP